MGLLGRITEPHKTIDYWTEALLLTTRDDYFGPTELCYLENKFYNIASNANRYTVTNANDPSLGNPTEEKICELDEFIDFAKLVIGAMGYKFLLPDVPKVVELPEVFAAKEENTLNELLYLDYAGVKATGMMTDDGFAVLKGSTLRSELVKTCPNSVIKMRDKHATAIKDFVLGKNILLKSPSGAATFVAGSSVNGYTIWKNKDGVTLKDILGRE
jgi:hypothetical protein